MSERFYDPCLRETDKIFLYYLNKHQVKYVVIGGHAVLFYARDRDCGVNDLDLVIECSKENALKFEAAMREYLPNAVYKWTVDDLAQPRKQLKVPAGDPIDVLTSLPTLSFDEVYQDPQLCQSIVVLPGNNEPSIFPVPFISRAHLIRLKQESIYDMKRSEDEREKDRKDIFILS